jgi:hypothetical protein
MISRAVLDQMQFRIARLLTGLAMLAAQYLAAAGPEMAVIREARSERALMLNGGFENARGDGLADWQSAPRRFRVAPGEGRNSTQAMQCENVSNDAWSGASQTIFVNQTNVYPLIIRGWSKATNVSGHTDSGYALYADLEYQDGLPLWGQTAGFRCGTHDWEMRELTILPDKPVKTLTLHCLLRGHTGKVWFDDVVAYEVKTKGNAAIFQGAPVQLSETNISPAATTGKTYRTDDGFSLTLNDNTVTSVRIGARELAAASPSGFLVRDVATNSDWYGFAGGNCGDLGLRLKSEVIAGPSHLAIQGRISDVTGRDRAVTLVFALPIAAAGWHWGDDIRHDRLINGNSEFANLVTVRCGATGKMSLYPLAAIWNSQVGLALATDWSKPALYRAGYSPATRQLFVAYDFGLVKESEQFPNSAEFRFVIYGFDRAWQFRAAFQKYTDIFPEAFQVRSRHQGLWMPFTDVGTVEGWRDFQFRYHEGNSQVPWDDAHEILSFRYTEPMTWWMPMESQVPRTPADALRVRSELSQGNRESQRRMARVTESTAMSDEDGEPALQFQETPWCRGAVWSLNPNPHLPYTPNAATVYWNPAVQQQLYGPEANGQLDGEYLDSLEGYVTADLNYRREHFRYTTVPLVFTMDTARPALFKGLAVYEFVRWISDDVHRRGKLMFANGVPYRFTFLCPWLDVMGTETDWLRDGKFKPVSDSTLCLWRTMSGQKPYLILMNTDYDVFGPSMVEQYFQIALFYGMWPGMFSHNAADNPYWQNPKWYNRDRPLFKKYLPLIKRVSEAGWQVIPGVTNNNDNIWAERYGPDAQGRTYLTLFNPTTESQTGFLGTRAQLGSSPGEITAATNLVSGDVFPREDKGWLVTLKPQQTALIALEKAKP